MEYYTLTGGRGLGGGGGGGGGVYTVNSSVQYDGFKNTIWSFSVGGKKTLKNSLNKKRGVVNRSWSQT